ncbi:MAG TPA: hypothetical protein VGL56_03155 [Fimbriimonadaceae bacterium]|jgi:hypothetical protein
MPQKISRRDFAKRAAGAAAGLVVAKSAMAQAPSTTPSQPVSDAEVDAITKQLAKPLTEEELKILKADLASQKQDTINRMKVKLPENSEPGFRFVPTGYKQPEEVEE